MIGFLPGHGVLHRAHPFTTLAVAGAAAVLVFVLPVPVGPLVLAAALILLAITAGVAQTLTPMIVIVFPFWFFLLVIHGVLGDDFGRAVVLGTRITTLVLGCLLVLATVHPGRLVDALVARGMPFTGAYLISATLQAVPRLRDRGRAILEAQRCRGLRVRGSLRRRAAAMVPLAIPLVLGALAEVDERAIALEARGIGAGVPRTPLDPPHDAPADRAVRWFLAIGTVVAVAVRLWG